MGTNIHTGQGQVNVLLHKPVAYIPYVIDQFTTEYWFEDEHLWFDDSQIYLHILYVSFTHYDT